MGFGRLGLRNQNQLAIPNASLGDKLVREASDPAHRPSKQYHFHAVVTIQMNVHRRDRQIVMIVGSVRESARQVARLMVVDVHDGTETARLR
jgi:hypothetical protein